MVSACPPRVVFKARPKPDGEPHGKGARISGSGHEPDIRPEASISDTTAGGW